FGLPLSALVSGFISSTALSGIGIHVILLTLPSSRRIGRAASDRFGEIGIIFAAAIAGFAATLSSAVLVASLVASRRLAESDALKLG
ncbi:hypothetical protein, partial [Burkholderia cenocepacia]|uniref:hypothetical protein n=1 Tax=Burkholderia cenocepacia TaxID=95486 RepID=UPI002237EAC3